MSPGGTLALKVAAYYVALLCALPGAVLATILGVLEYGVLHRGFFEALLELFDKGALAFLSLLAGTIVLLVAGGFGPGRRGGGALMALGGATAIGVVLHVIGLPDHASALILFLPTVLSIALGGWLAISGNVAGTRTNVSVPAARPPG